MISLLHRLCMVACLAGVLTASVEAQARSRGGTQIRFRGLTSITEQQALRLLGDRLFFARNKPPTPALAEDAAFMLRRLLQNQGFPDPTITPSISGNTIILDVSEGPRRWLGSVFVEGPEKKESERLSLLFSSVGVKRNRIGGNRTPFRGSDIQEGLDMLLADYHSRGYWAAEVELEKRAIDPKTGEVKLVIQTKAGPLHLIGRSRIEGDAGDLSSDLRALAAESAGQPANTAAINQVRSLVEAEVRRRGYRDAGISMSVDKSGSTVSPVFTITVGQRYMRGELAVVGLERTRESAILRFSEGLEEGGPYDSEDIERRIRGLLATGAFSAVRFETNPRGEFLDSTLIIEEGEARGYSFYTGFGNYDGGIIGFRYYDRNFGGRLLNLSVGGEYNDRGILGEVRLVKPWIDGAGSSLGGRLFSFTRDHEGYDKWETGLSATFTRMMGDRAPFSAELRASWNEVTPDGIIAPLLGDTSYGHLFLRLSQSIDRRDNPLVPTDGWHASVAVQVGMASGTQQVGYIKLEGAASWHTPIATDHHLSLGFRAGAIAHSGSSFDLPIDLRFFLGGPDSVRSYPERELGPRAFSNDPLGGEAYWVFNAEYVHQLAGPLKFVAFVDAGGLSLDVESQGFDEVEIAAGLGLRLDLPIGPIRLEYGHNLTQDINEPSGTWHIAIGIAF